MAMCRPVSGRGYFIFTSLLMFGKVTDANAKGFLFLCSNSGSVRKALKLPLPYSRGERNWDTHITSPGSTPFEIK